MKVSRVKRLKYEIAWGRWTTKMGKIYSRSSRVKDFFILKLLLVGRMLVRDKVSRLASVSNQALKSLYIVCVQSDSLWKAI